MFAFFGHLVINIQKQCFLNKRDFVWLFGFLLLFVVFFLFNRKRVFTELLSLTFFPHLVSSAKIGATWNSSCKHKWQEHLKHMFFKEEISSRKFIAQKPTGLLMWYKLTAGSGVSLDKIFTEFKSQESKPHKNYSDTAIHEVQSNSDL